MTLVNPDPSKYQPCSCQKIHLAEPTVFRLGRVPYYNQSLNKYIHGNCKSCNWNDEGTTPGWTLIKQENTEISQERMKALLEL